MLPALCRLPERGLDAEKGETDEGERPYDEQERRQIPAGG